MPYHTVREILALLSSSKNRPNIINKVMVKGRWEGSKARINRESCMHLPPLAEEARSITLTASAQQKGELRAKGQQPGPADFFQMGSDYYFC